MSRLVFILLFSLFLSCGGSNSEDQNTNSPNTNNDFPSYVDSNNLRIFARNGVSETFSKNVGTAYEEMLKENSQIRKTRGKTAFTKPRAIQTTTIPTPKPTPVFLTIA